MENRTENEKLEFLQEIDRVWKLSVNEMEYLDAVLSMLQVRENI
jgi:hypothetical protein